MTQANIHGRKWGRGMRPWILLPKYLAVSLVIGGIFSAGVLTAGAGQDLLHRTMVWDQVSRIFRLVIIPGTALSVIFGFALFLQHPKAFWGMRWFRLKLALIVGLVPLSHLTCSLALGRLQADPMMPQQVLARGLLYALATFVLISIIGRLKPRLNQKYAAGRTDGTTSSE